MRLYINGRELEFYCLACGSLDLFCIHNRYSYCCIDCGHEQTVEDTHANARSIDPMTGESRE